MKDRTIRRWAGWLLLAMLVAGCAGTKTATVYDREGVALLVDRNPEAAIAELEKGLSDPQVTGDPEAAFRILELLGWAHGEARQFAAAEKYLGRALSVAEASGMDPAVVYARIAVVRAKAGRFPEGVSAAEKAMGLTADRWRERAGGGSTMAVIDYAVSHPGFPPDENMIRAAIMSEAALAVLHFGTGDVAEAVRWGERTVRHGEQLGFLMKMAPALDRVDFYQGVGVAAGAASQAHARLGNPEKQQEMLEAGVRAFEAIGVTVAGDDLLAAYLASGRPPSAVSSQREKRPPAAEAAAPATAGPARDARYSEAYHRAERLHQDGSAQEAEAAYNRVITSADRTKDAAEAARARSQLGWLLAEQGRYAEAIRYLEKSAVSAPREGEKVMSLVRLAAVLARLGRIEASLRRADQALEVAVSNRPGFFQGTDRQKAMDRFVQNPGLPPDAVLLKAVLGSEAARTVSHYFNGDYAQTVRIGQAALEHFRQAESAVSIAPALDRRDYTEGIGYTALCTGDALTFLDRAEEGRQALAEAERYFTRSGSRFGVYAARALTACSYLREKRYDRAARTLGRIWEALHSLELEDILWRSKARFAYYFDLHTRQHLQQLADMRLEEAGDGPLSPDQIQFRQAFAGQATQALSAISLLLDAEAAATVENAAVRLRTAESRKALAEAANELAGAIRQAAYDNYRQAVEHVESVRARLETDLNKQAFRADKQLLYEGYVRLSVILHGARAGLEAVERAKARELLDLLAGRRIAFKHRKLADAERGIRLQAGRQLAEAAAEGRDRSAVEPLLERYRGVMVQIRKEAPELASLLGAEPPGFEQVEAVVPRPGALLTFYAASESLYIFVARAGKVHVRQTPVSAEVLARHVSNYREAVFLRRGDAEKRKAKQLYALLLQPVESLLLEKRLVVVPDGPLHYLPFAALSDGQLRLCQRFSLSFAPSAGVLYHARAKTPPEKRSVLALGNPDLDDPRLALPAAQLEAIQVAELYPGSLAIVGKRATETAVKQRSSDYSILHFATHGEFSSADPLYSGLRLAGDDRNDGRLEAAEIFSLDLAAEVATLSACRTGLGLVTRGGEIIGLNRAFLYAGAPRVLASLWNVSDESTRLLMLDFYRNLQLMPADRALQEAQLRLMRSKGQSAPFYWAPFYLTGDWR